MPRRRLGPDARPAGYHVPDRAGYFAAWSQLHGGYDPSRAFWPRQWLSLTYLLAAPLARRGVPPNVLTAAGVLVSAGVPALVLPGGHWVLLATAVVIASGLADSADGAVAAMTGRSTPLGYVLDSSADRLSDGLYVLALWLLGGLPWLCVFGWVAAMLQEYVRARATSAGMSDIGVVTVSERPTRLLITAFAMAAAGAAPPYAALVATAGAAAWLGFSVIGVGQLLVAVRRLAAKSAS